MMLLNHFMIQQLMSLQLLLINLAAVTVDSVSALSHRLHLNKKSDNSYKACQYRQTYQQIDPEEEHDINDNCYELSLSDSYNHYGPTLNQSNYDFDWSRSQSRSPSPSSDMNDKFNEWNNYTQYEPVTNSNFKSDSESDILSDSANLYDSISHDSHIESEQQSPVTLRSARSGQQSSHSFEIVPDHDTDDYDFNQYYHVHASLSSSDSIKQQTSTSNPTNDTVTNSNLNKLKLNDYDSQSDSNTTTESDLEVVPLLQNLRLSNPDSMMTQNSFTIQNSSFLLNGKPFKIHSGEIHWFRIPEKYWEDRLLRMKAMGLNTIQTYIPWSYWEEEERMMERRRRKGSSTIKLLDSKDGSGPYQGPYVKQHLRFLQLVAKLNLFAIVRPGPYICGEYAFGGFPERLGMPPEYLPPDSNVRNMKDIRTNDKVYLEEEVIGKFLKKLLQEELKDMMYINQQQQEDKVSGLGEGVKGTILMLQVENEYGAFGDTRFRQNDREYMITLRNTIRKYIQQDLDSDDNNGQITLFTADPLWSTVWGGLPPIPNQEIHDNPQQAVEDFVLHTVDYGPPGVPLGNLHNGYIGEMIVEKLNPKEDQVQVQGLGYPYYVAELYTGWLSFYGKHSNFYNISPEVVANQWISTNEIPNFNLYMAVGGSNFEFQAGANVVPSGKFRGVSWQPIPQSYDYGAPIGENGRHNVIQYGVSVAEDGRHNMIQYGGPVAEDGRHNVIWEDGRHNMIIGESDSESESKSIGTTVAAPKATIDKFLQYQTAIESVDQLLPFPPEPPLIPRIAYPSVILTKEKNTSSLRNHVIKYGMSYEEMKQDKRCREVKPQQLSDSESDGKSKTIYKFSPHAITDPEKIERLTLLRFIPNTDSIAYSKTDQDMKISLTISNVRDRVYVFDDGESVTETTTRSKFYEQNFDPDDEYQIINTNTNSNESEEYHNQIEIDDINTNRKNRIHNYYDEAYNDTVSDDHSIVSNTDSGESNDEESMALLQKTFADQYAYGQSRGKITQRRHKNFDQSDAILSDDQFYVTPDHIIYYGNQSNSSESNSSDDEFQAQDAIETDSKQTFKSYENTPLLSLKEQDYSSQCNLTDDENPAVPRKPRSLSVNDISTSSQSSNLNFSPVHLANRIINGVRYYTSCNGPGIGSDYDHCNYRVLDQQDNLDNHSSTSYSKQTGRKLVRRSNSSPPSFFKRNSKSRNTSQGPGFLRQIKQNLVKSLPDSIRKLKLKNLPNLSLRKNQNLTKFPMASSDSNQGFPSINKKKIIVTKPSVTIIDRPGLDKFEDSESNPNSVTDSKDTHKIELNTINNNSIIDLILEVNGLANFGYWMRKDVMNKGVVVEMPQNSGVSGNWFECGGLLEGRSVSLPEIIEDGDTYKMIDHSETVTESASLSRASSDSESDPDNLIGPSFYTGTFHIDKFHLVLDKFNQDSDSDYIPDTYLDLSNTSIFKHGHIFINNRHLGNYWTSLGPQYSVYLPGAFLRIGDNKITILEMENDVESVSSNTIVLPFSKDPIVRKSQSGNGNGSNSGMDIENPMETNFQNLGRRIV